MKFNTVSSYGLTFETWIYMTARPKKRPNGFLPDGQWLIFAKPGSYYATVSARTLTDGHNRTRPEGTGDCVMPKTGTSIQDAGFRQMQIR